MKKKTQLATGQAAQTIDDLPQRLAAPARRALVGAGYTSLAQLSALTETELLQLHGMGPKAISQLRQVLAAAGMSFADSPTN